MADSGYSYKTLSENSGVSRTTISYAKNGKECMPNTIGKIAKTLNVHVSELIEEKEVKNESAVSS